MTNQETLTKAIELAIKGGYHTWDFDDRYTKDDEREYLLGTLYDDPSENSNVQSVEALIFNHDFAKALWGETKPLENGEYPPEVIMYKGKPMWHPWKHHLQNMVIADDPIAYLAENM